MMQVSLVNDSRSRRGVEGARCSALGARTGPKDSSCGMGLVFREMGGSSDSRDVAGEGRDDQGLSNQQGTHAGVT
jgi:hypothetical protein